MAIQLNVSNYQSLISSITSMLGSGQYKAITMTVFNDFDETSISNDAYGAPIHNRAVSSATTKSEYTDENGNIFYGTVTVHFTDGTFFVSTETLNSYWYSLSGVSILQR